MFLTVNICTYYIRMCTYINNLKKGGGEKLTADANSSRGKE